MTVKITSQWTDIGRAGDYHIWARRDQNDILYHATKGEAPLGDYGFCTNLKYLFSVNAINCPGFTSYEIQVESGYRVTTSPSGVEFFGISVWSTERVPVNFRVTSFNEFYIYGVITNVCH